MFSKTRLAYTDPKKRAHLTEDEGQTSLCRQKNDGTWDVRGKPLAVFQVAKCCRDALRDSLRQPSSTQD